jgi:outer membrane lipoprotein-sorting protein
MFNKTVFILGFVLFSIHLSWAQTNAEAEQIITSLLSDAKNNAIKTNFKLAIGEKSNSPLQTTSGIFIIKANKFVLEMDEIKVFFDGKTQWSYLAKSNEVSITEPSEKELAETNPMAILSSFKSKSTIQTSKKTKSAQNYCIEMLPKIKNQDISKIEVQVNKTNGNLFSIKLINKKGGSSVLTLNGFQKGIKVNDNAFIFDKTKYKNVMENDLR